MSYPAIRDVLSDGGVVLLDGPTGTELQRRGAEVDEAAWVGPVSLSHRELLTEIHADYIRAGCDVITANTYASSRLMLEPAGYGDQVEAANRAAVEAALAARERVTHGRPVAVAGSLSHMIPVAGGTAKSDEAAAPDDATVSAALHELAAIHAAAGCDLIILEMMYHPRRMRLAVEAALASGLPVWVGLSARRGADGTPVSYYQHAELPLDRLLDEVPGGRVDAVGVMHSDATITGDALKAVRARYPGPLMAYPDSGYFEMPNWRFVDVMTTEVFRGHCQAWLEQGVQILGGCCGLSLAHIEAIADLKFAKG